MKKQFIKTIPPLCILIIAVLTIGVGCNGTEPDDEYTCNYAGYSTTTNTYTNTAESNLTTDFFHTSSNGPEVEIYG